MKDGELEEPDEIIIITIIKEEEEPTSSVIDLSLSCKELQGRKAGRMDGLKIT